MQLKDIERKGKALLKKAFHLIPESRSLSPEILAKRRIERILAVRIDNRLGNLLLITPFLRRLRGCFPGTRIDLLVSRAFAEVLEGNPNIDRLIVADKAGFIRRPWRFVRFVRDMRGNHYNLCIDLSSSHTFSVTSGCAVRLSGSPLRLGFRRGESDRFLNIQVDPPVESMHEAAIHLSLLDGLGQGDNNLDLDYTVSEDELLAGQEVVTKLGLEGGPIIAVFIGARGEKAWGDDRFIEVAGELSKTFPVLIMGGDNEAGRIEFIRGAIDSVCGSGMEKRIGIAPLMPIRTFAALVSHCSLFISGDCGPMHLASALGIPVLAIFNVDNYVKYGPLGEGNRVLYEPEENIPSHVVKIAREMLHELPRSEKTDRTGAIT